MQAEIKKATILEQQDIHYPISIEDNYKKYLTNKLPPKLHLSDLSDIYGGKEIVLENVINGNFPEPCWERHVIIEFIAQEFCKEE